MIYVSIPDRNEIAFVSTASHEVVDRVFVGSRPLGIDLSRDRSRLFIALNQAAAVSVLDLESKSVSEIIVGGSNGTDNSLIYDVVESPSGTLFVSASPGSGGTAGIAKVDLLNGNAVSRVANNRIIRASPTFLKSPGDEVLYLGEGFNPNSLYKLDITQPTAPIILEDDHGTVSGTNAMDISPDGSRIYLSSGQVLRSDSFLQAGRIGSGTPSVSSDGSIVLVGVSQGIFGDPSKIDVYNANTFLLEDTISIPSDPASIDHLDFLTSNGMDFGFALLRDNNLYISMIPEPNSLLVFTGIALLFCTRKP